MGPRAEPAAAPPGADVVESAEGAKREAAKQAERARGEEEPGRLGARRGAVARAPSRVRPGRRGAAAPRTVGARQEAAERQVWAGHPLPPAHLLATAIMCASGRNAYLNDGLACTLGSQCASNACTVYYHDGDGDGYGAGTPSNFCGTAALVGYATQGGDCCDDNAVINPGADFHTTIGSCDGVTTWDYNCNGTAEPQKTGSISVPNGCVSGASCTSCTANPMVEQLVVQTCGAWTTGTICISAACSATSQCMAPTAEVYQQACR